MRIKSNGAALAPHRELVEKPTVFRQFTDFACSSQTRNCTKPQGMGCAGTARLAHELYLKTVPRNYFLIKNFLSGL